MKQAPDRGFPQAQSAHDNFWDFISLMPEATHMVMWTMSDRAIPRSFRFMEGFGVHTFRFVNAAGESTFVKFHWKPKLGMQSVVWNEAVKINGADPDFHRRDLWDAIQAGDFPEWELGVQLFDDEFADRFEFDVLDATKIIPEEQVPVRRVGRLVLDRMVDNFFAETEQVAFCTQNVVPGIDFTNDPLLQGRNFSYLDTQLKRLGGPNFTHLPVNAPKCPVAHFQQDGHMAMVNPVGRVNYEPNSWNGDGGGPREDPAERLPDVPGRGGRAEAAPAVGDVRRPLQPGAPVPRQPDAGRAGPHRQRLRVRARQVRAPRHPRAHGRQPAQRRRGLRPAHRRRARARRRSRGQPAGAPTDRDLPASPALSIVRNGPDRFAGRKVGVLVTDGTDGEALDALAEALTAEGALLELVAPTVGGVTTSTGKRLAAHQSVDGGPSVLYDAVAVLPSADGAAVLAGNAAAKDFVTDAHAHCKFIGHNEAARALFDAAGLTNSVDDGYLALDDGDATKFVETCRAVRFWDRESATGSDQAELATELDGLGS